MNVSVIIPLYKPSKSILNKILKSLDGQDFEGKIEIIQVGDELGLADSFNYGVKKAKHGIIVSLHQDCIPKGRGWLSKLTAPLKNKDVVATVSKVYLPYSLWKDFDVISKILSSKEQKIIQPAMDEKGCAFKKTILEKVGLFDGKNFRTAGEDYDMYIKLKNVGKIEYPNTLVYHMHYYTWKNRLKKELQLSNGFGALFRIYGRKLPLWFGGLVKSLPLLGFPLFFVKLNIKKLGLLSLLAVPVYLFVNFVYTYGFWKGFIYGRQTV